MRIIKLSKEEFKDKVSIKEFFFSDLPNRENPGAFYLTKGRLSSEKFSFGEKIVFSYEGKAIFISESASDILDSNDQDKDKYPTYFQVNLEKLIDVTDKSISLEHIEDLFKFYSGEYKNLLKSQGWPMIEDTTFTELLWRYFQL